MYTHDTRSIDEVIEYLNELNMTDGAVTFHFVEHRVLCNQALADHPTCQVMEDDGKTLVGAMGILNGIFGVDDQGRGPIAAVFDDEDGSLVRFQRDRPRLNQEAQPDPSLGQPEHVAMGMADEYYVIPEYMRGGIIRYVHWGVEPGDFWEAVIKDQFVEATCRADVINLLVIKVYALLAANHMPNDCRRSRYGKWMEERQESPLKREQVRWPETWRDSVEQVFREVEGSQ